MREPGQAKAKRKIYTYSNLAKDAVKDTRSLLFYKLLQ
jgi:hypothetical protein